jgi:hypothetical protein
MLVNVQEAETMTSAVAKFQTSENWSELIRMRPPESMTGLIWSKPLAKERVKPPDFLLSPAGLTSFMRLSLMKAAHAVTVRTAHRKSGYPAAARPADIETVKQLRS